MKIFERDQFNSDEIILAIFKAIKQSHYAPQSTIDFLSKYEVEDKKSGKATVEQSQHFVPIKFPNTTVYVCYTVDSWRKYQARVEFQFIKIVIYDSMLEYEASKAVLLKKV